MEALAGRVILSWGFRRWLLALASGAVGALAMPPVSFFFSLFVAFTLLVWLLDGATPGPEGGFLGALRAAFFTGWTFGLGYFTAGLWWLGNALMLEADEFAWALPLAVLGLPAVLALFYGLAALLARLLWSDGLGRIFALAAGFGLAEWLRSFVATGFPWNAIGYGAMPIPLMMQSARVFGLFGVTALAVLVFAMPALLGGRKGRGLGFALAGLLVVCHLGYGAYRLSIPDEPASATVTIRLVQPVIDQSRKMDDRDRDAIFEEHLALAAAPPKTGMQRPDLVIWPETSLPFILTENPDALTRIADILQDGQVLITGAVRSEDQGPGNAPRFYNSIYAIDDRGQIVAASDKVHLTPFGEYVPFESVLRRFGIQNLISLPGGFTAAATRQVLRLPNGRTLFPSICYEIVFPQEVASELQAAEAIVNITNDAWFGVSPGPYQHFLQARLRAVENGVPVIRDANNGISALIDARGRILAGLALNVRGIVDATIDLKSGSERDNYNLNNNYWLLMLSIAAMAFISRMGFIFGKN